MSRVRRGMLTPSSHTVPKPVTAALLAEVPEASARVGRFAATEIALCAPALEAEPGVPVIDSISAVVWTSLRLAGIDTRRVTCWGRPFQED